MINDYYELLQVHPRADAEAITASYQRLRQRYDPTGMSGPAAELAREKIAALDTAYAVISDPAQRQAYDAKAQQSVDQTLDYRPLPPARGKERARTVAAPTMTQRPTSQDGPPPWRTPALVAVVLLVIIVPLAMLITNIPQDSTTTPPVTTAIPATGSVGGANVELPTGVLAQPTVSPVDQFEQAVEVSRQRAEANPNDISAWIDYANYLYDSTVIAREQDSNGEVYKARIPRWLEAAKAYQRALKLAPNNAVVRSDYGSTYCFYGSSVTDQAVVQKGLQEVQAALDTAPQEPRVLLNMGNCLVSLTPPQTDKALQYWQTILQVAPNDQTARQAQWLIDRYDGQ